MKRLLFILLAGLAGVPSLALARLEAGLGLSPAWPRGELQEQVDFAWEGPDAPAGLSAAGRRRPG